MKKIIIVIAFCSTLTVFGQAKISAVMGVSPIKSIEDFDTEISYTNPSASLGYNVVNMDGLGYGAELQYTFEDGRTYAGDYDVGVSRTFLSVYGRYDKGFGNDFYYFGRAGVVFNLDLVEGDEDYSETFGAFGVSTGFGVGKSLGAFSIDLSHVQYIIFGKASAFPIRLGFNLDI